MTANAADMPVARSVPAVRLAVALAQGVALLTLYRVLHPAPSPQPHAPLFAAAIMVACCVPVLAHLGVGRLRPRVLVAWAVGAAVLLAGLAVHDVLRLAPAERTAEPSWFLMVFGVCALFILHGLIASGDSARRWIADYPTYFDAAWPLGLRLVLSALFVGLFWLLLYLGAALFGAIGLPFLRHLIERDWFAIPVSTLAVGAGIHLTDMRDGLVQGVRVMALTLLSWLLPVLAILAVCFLAALPFTGLGRLWAVGHATSVLLASIAALIVLINAAYQDGGPGTPARGALRLPSRVAAFVLWPLTVLAAVGLWLRIAQYGLTPDRIVAAACVLVALLYAGGYAVAAAWPARAQWVVARTNIGTAFVVVGLILALLSPLADPARLAVADQMRRLANGAVDPAKFDYAFLQRDGARYGVAALQDLRDGKGAASSTIVAARAREALERKARDTARATPVKAADMPVHPSGKALPTDFLDQDWTEVRGGKPQCLQDATGCSAVLADLNGDGVDEILINTHGRSAVYERQSEGGWVLVGWLEGERCRGTLDALRRGAFTLAPPIWRDVIIGADRLVLQPAHNCGEAR